MKLHIKDRIYFAQLLPQQSNYMEFNLKRGILNKVAIDEATREQYSIKEDKENHNITWDGKKDMETPLEIEFTKEELAFLQKGCEQLADTQQSDDFWLVVEKIYDAVQASK